MPVATDHDSKMAALALANEVRAWRKALKEDLKAGRVTLADALLSDADHLQGMKVRDLLLATPGIGKHKATRAMGVHLMSDSARVLGTTDSRREELLDFLAKKHPRIEIGWEAKRYCESNQDGGEQ